MYGCLEEKRGLWMTNRAAHTEWFVMEVLMTMLLKGYFWVVFSFSLTSTPLCSHQRVHFVSYYLPLFQHNPECNCSVQQIRGWQNQMRMKKIMREKERERGLQGEKKVLNQRGLSPAGFQLKGTLLASTMSHMGLCRTKGNTCCS